MTGDSGGITQHPGWLALDCPRVGVREISQLYRDFAVACVNQQVDRALLQATDGDADDHLGLRDAFTMMLLAGIPSGFRVALLARSPRVLELFQALRADLRRLRVDAAVFVQETEALDWLAPSRPTPAAPSPCDGAYAA
jgi:hypothetical protein